MTRALLIGAEPAVSLPYTYVQTPPYEAVVMGLHVRQLHKSFRAFLYKAYIFCHQLSKANFSIFHCNE